MSVREWKLNELAVGTKAGFEQRIEEADVDRFAKLSGDENPLHTDADFARQTGFRGRVVHGALLAALVSRLIGMELPGRHGLLLALKLDFVSPTFAGDLVHVTGEIESVHPAQNAVSLRIVVRCLEEVRVRGTALVRVRQ